MNESRGIVTTCLFEYSHHLEELYYVSVCLLTDTYLRGWNIPPFRFCLCCIILFSILFGSVMTHNLSCIDIIIDLKFIYHSVEYSILLFFRAFWSYISTRYREWWNIPMVILI